MKAFSLALVFLAAALFLFLRFWPGTEKPAGRIVIPEVETSIQATVNVAGGENPLTSVQESTSAPPEIPAVGLEKLTVDQLIPSAEQIRGQVQSNPHVTPKALRIFASQMAIKMKKAQEDSAYARVLFDECLSCTHRDDSTYLAIKMSCAINGLRLSRSLGLSRDQYIKQLSPALRHAIEVAEAIN